MNTQTDPRTLPSTDVRVAAQLDVGLRKYMLRVYNYMASGVALTGAVAAGVAGSEELMRAIFGTPVFWLVVLAPLGLVIFLSARINHIKARTAQTVFWCYAALVGVSIASIFVVYTGESIARVFFIAAASFSGLSLWGYTTKKDLSGMGSFLVMGLFGILIAGLVNLFLESSALQFTISALGVLIFAGLTAYDTQRIKAIYYEGDSAETADKKAVMGALALYLDFLNIFLFLLQFLGARE